MITKNVSGYDDGLMTYEAAIGTDTILIAATMFQGSFIQRSPSFL
jgi:hypothetical protein